MGKGKYMSQFYASESIPRHRSWVSNDETSKTQDDQPAPLQESFQFFDQ
jgi:hypothetical protein